MTSQRRSGTSSFYGADSQSSNRILVSLGGAITDNYILKSFGEEYGVTGSTTNPYRYVGQFEYHRDTANLQYVRARNLDVLTGRWISRDPIGFDGGDWNLYRYVGNIPTSGIDPTGNSGYIPPRPTPPEPPLTGPKAKCKKSGWRPLKSKDCRYGASVFFSAGFATYDTGRHEKHSTCIAVSFLQNGGTGSCSARVALPLDCVCKHMPDSGPSNPKK